MSLARRVRRNSRAQLLTTIKAFGDRVGIPWCRKCRRLAADLYELPYDFKQKNGLENVERGQAWRCQSCKTLWLSDKLKKEKA